MDYRNMHWLYSTDHDLTSPDGRIVNIYEISNNSCRVGVLIENISPLFKGFEIDIDLVYFNLKSALGQLGFNAVFTNVTLDKSNLTANIDLSIHALSHLGSEFLKYIVPGMFIGKLFAADDRRLVRSTYYLERMLSHTDRENQPLLDLCSNNYTSEIIDGRLIAFIPLLDGVVEYDDHINGMFPFLQKALCKNYSVRSIISFHQLFLENKKAIVHENQMLLVKTSPLHARTIFSRVVSSLLPKGISHCSADVLQPDTVASGDIYEVYGDNPSETLTHVPLEFFTLESHREHVFFEYRDLLRFHLDNQDLVFSAFDSIKDKNPESKATAFISKGSQLEAISENDWIYGSDDIIDLDAKNITLSDPVASKYIKSQPCYEFLHAMEAGSITSQGVLFTRFFPSGLMKNMLLSYYVRKILKQVYFLHPSQSHGMYFSSFDRSLLADLYVAGIQCFWVEPKSRTISRFVKRDYKNSGMFVPVGKEECFKNACFFGVYGSNLGCGHFQDELRSLLCYLKDVQENSTHSSFNKDMPMALITGGGPGSMEMGNRLAKELGILSCANIVNLSNVKGLNRSQEPNKYIEAKMTFRRENIIERQESFYLDFPIFVEGGIGTDFELALEEVSFKVGIRSSNPILIFGSRDYVVDKLTHKYQRNLKSKTISGVEWICNAFFRVDTAKQAAYIYKKFFDGEIIIGPEGPVYDDGFCDAPSVFGL